jgi:uncharacterized protein (TIGR00297 family)
MQRVLLGLLLSAAIGYAGYTKDALSRSGAVGAVLIGTAVFGLGGWDWGILLIAFFVSSSLLSRYRRLEKASLAEKFAKGSRRDLGQTMANGGLGALLAIGSALYPHWLWLAAYVGAMATVNADTWATEVGVLSRTRPRLITSGQEVEVGTSGAVSWLGTTATLAGGLFIGLLAALLQLAWQGEEVLGQAWLLLLAGLLGGLGGSLFDSLLGATVQAIYYCDRCAKETERPLHHCGTETRRLRGWRWLDNDLVNLTSSAVGAAVASGLAITFL